jgi:hypothetical protein
LLAPSSSSSWPSSSIPRTMFASNALQLVKHVRDHDLRIT